MTNMFDPYRNVVHLGYPNSGGEFTLCGLAFDEPSSEWGCDSMRDIKTPCTCPECKSMAKELLPYLKREMKRF